MVRFPCLVLQFSALTTTFIPRFKLHLRSTPVGSTAADAAIPPLPAGKRAVDVLADFLHYLRACAAAYIAEAHLGGADLWAATGADARYVLAHPNGWGGAEQARMRDAAVRAGLVRASEPARVSFVTEGEASLHFCVSAGVLAKAEMKVQVRGGLRSVMGLRR